MFRIPLVLGLFAAITACGGGTKDHATVAPARRGATILHNDLAGPVTMRGCLGCGSGIVVTHGRQRQFYLPPGSIKLTLTTPTGDRCFTILNGAPTDKPLLLQASKAGSC